MTTQILAALAAPLAVGLLVPLTVPNPHVCRWVNEEVVFPCSACSDCACVTGHGQASVLAVLLYQKLPHKPEWADRLDYDVTLAKPSRLVEAALDKPSNEHYYGRLTKSSTDFAKKLADGKERDTMQAMRALLKNPQKRAPLDGSRQWTNQCMLMLLPFPPHTLLSPYPPPSNALLSLCMCIMHVND